MTDAEEDLMRAECNLRAVRYEHARVATKLVEAQRWHDRAYYKVHGVRWCSGCHMHLGVGDKHGPRCGENRIETTWDIPT